MAANWLKATAASSGLLAVGMLAAPLPAEAFSLDNYHGSIMDGLGSLQEDIEVKAPRGVRIKQAIDFKQSWDGVREWVRQYQLIQPKNPTRNKAGKIPTIVYINGITEPALWAKDFLTKAHPFEKVPWNICVLYSVTDRPQRKKRYWQKKARYIHQRAQEKYEEIHNKKSGGQNRLDYMLTGKGSDRLGKLLPTWNAGACCGKAAEENFDDNGYVNQVLEKLVDKHDADPDALFLVGRSNGAQLAMNVVESYHFNASYHIAGVATNVGWSFNKDIPKTRVPLFMQTGAEDPVFVEDGCCGKQSAEQYQCPHFDITTRQYFMNKIEPHLIRENDQQDKREGGPCTPVDKKFNSWRRKNKCENKEGHEAKDKYCERGTNCDAATVWCHYKKLGHTDWDKTWYANAVVWMTQLYDPTTHPGIKKCARRQFHKDQSICSSFRTDTLRKFAEQRGVDEPIKTTIAPDHADEGTTVSRYYE